MRRTLRLLLLLGTVFALRRTGGDGGGTPNRPKDGDGGDAGDSGRPAQRHGDIDASQGTGSAQDAIQTEFEQGRGGGTSPTGENQAGQEGQGEQQTPSRADDFPEDFTMPASVTADTIAAHADQRSIPGVEDADLPEYIENIISSPGTTLRSTPNGTSRMAWWDESTGTMIIREGNNGTFMQPDRGYQYFLEQAGE